MIECFFVFSSMICRNTKCLKRPVTQIFFDGGERSPRGVVANVLDSDITVSKIKLQSPNYFPFWINTLGKGMNPLFSSVMG